MSRRRATAKIVDCTIRDGGLVNNWDFSVEFVRDVYKSLSEAGVDYMEIGYKNSPKLLKADNVGPWRFLDEELLKKTIGEKTHTKLSALVDVGRVDENDIVPRSESYLDMIRVACYIKEVDKALELIEKFHALGYETTINIMAVSNATEVALSNALDLVNESNVDVVYIVDSFGSLYGTDIEYLVSKFKKHVPNKELGIHTHNNLQLAFANSITAESKGVNYLDASIYGMGRAAGNCPTELLVNYLENPKYDVRSIMGVIERRLIPLQQQVEWGYIIPYTIAGMLNEHPRVAMALRNSEDKDKYLDFYDQLTSVETQVNIPAAKTESKVNS
ncbi:aldolase catalytic domain-containing protein [Ammoniphilus sp. YIM 78166]|uniref:aldolase catalytic domain-containing protein n=1 Tax=Ammoniphilus sp. YIM 78166 TaxID=1644106 RepID=UPI0010704D5A|nr:aldolase catalytic domain-containing protein [Ammoniphilus sp. YIM 78166]